MRILLTSDWPMTSINGVVASIKTLKIELEKRGHDVKVLVFNDSYTNDKSEDNIYSLGSLSANKIYPNARLGILPHFHYYEEIKSWRPDIIHSNCEFFTFIKPPNTH